MLLTPRWEKPATGSFTSYGTPAIVAVCALIGGWVGLAGIVVTAVALIVFAGARM